MNPLRTVAPSPYPSSMAGKIGAAALVGLMAFAATACGGDDKPSAKADETPAASEPSATEAAGGISEDCKLAVLNWETIARAQTADLAFGAPDNAGDPAINEHANEIETYCPQEIQVKVAEINYRLAVGEAKLTSGEESSGDDVAALTIDIVNVSGLAK